MQFNSLAQRLCFVPQLRPFPCKEHANQTHVTTCRTALRAGTYGLYGPISSGNLVAFSATIRCYPSFVGVGASMQFNSLAQCLASFLSFNTSARIKRMESLRKYGWVGLCTTRLHSGSKLITQIINRQYLDHRTLVTTSEMD
ncbi:hypothetical protein Ga0061065_104180 [Marinomonas fungiae]|uniref:Uncharacterized protein n=1 Tax=Marinomonas fungiae TaxID=1137284 RepID=A0A0K6IKW7_9GAMM|nr:hypothetical protein Ga0061065_104180 [Marinomonas fungiae]